MEHFSKDISEEEEITIGKCLELVEFGISITLITPIDKYYEYGCDIEGEKRGRL